MRLMWICTVCLYPIKEARVKFVNFAQTKNKDVRQRISSCLCRRGKGSKRLLSGSIVELKELKSMKQYTIID